jgi:hypothetical protein
LDRIEETLTDALSALGKFDAEQREQMRIFVETAKKPINKRETVTRKKDMTLLLMNCKKLPITHALKIAQLKSELQQYQTPLKYLTTTGSSSSFD